MSHPLLTGLSGYTICHNGIRGDYPLKECVQSLLPVCDEVLVACASCDDGTLEMMTRFATTDPKIRVVNIDWPRLPTYDEFKADAPRPLNNSHFWPQLLNSVRPLLRYQFQLSTDADEILSPTSFDEIRRCMAENGTRYFKRLNFWRDAQSLVPPNWVCGEYVARLGSTDLMMVSDEHHPEGEPEIKVRAQKHDSLVFFHYGFLRKQEAFFAKSKVLQPAIVGNYDLRLEEAERTGQNWWEVSTFPAELVPYEGEHPECIRQWLIDRGRL